MEINFQTFLGPSSIKLENKGDLCFFHKIDEVSLCSPAALWKMIVITAISSLQIIYTCKTLFSYLNVLYMCVWICSTKRLNQSRLSIDQKRTWPGKAKSNPKVREQLNSCWESYTLTKNTWKSCSKIKVCLCLCSFVCICAKILHTNSQIKCVSIPGWLV